MPAAIPDYVSSARDSVTNAGNVMQQYAGKEFSISDELKNVLNDATTPGKQDWSNINATTMANYLGSPTEARAMYRDPESEHYIFNPAQSAEAMNEFTKEKEIPFLASTQLFGMMNKGEKEMIDSGTRAFQAKQAAAQAAYQTAQQVYSNLLDEFKITEASRQFDEELALKKSEAAKTGSGSKRSTQIIQMDGQNVLVDTQTGEKIQILGPVQKDTPNPSLINIGDKPYEYTPGASLKQLDMPSGGGGDPWYQGLMDFFSPKKK